ncbi:hypothetical protein [Haloarcula salinisoli]|nr:hypothetical protein [Halomicroarcula salinisoli]
MRTSGATNRECADLIVLDVDKPKFSLLTNVPTHVVNNPDPA